MNRSNSSAFLKSIPALSKALGELEAGFSDLPPFTARNSGVKMAAALTELGTRLKDNFPYFHPLYAGQMLKPPHPVAHMAYALAMYINPNNHALDGGRATSIMEREAVEQLARMFGWKRHLGHLTSGGTMANLEALWIAGKLRPGKKILASSQAHYTHERISAVLQLDFQSVQSGTDGRMDLNRLEQRLKKGDIGTVVATMGTTATGAVENLPEILRLQKHYDFRIHADAAYGGYFILAGNLADEVQKSLAAIAHADSIVIDPHKHGLQPYGCGCVLFRDPAVGRFYKHDSPYTYFSSKELHLGEISLECSRPGAAAAALWTTQRMLPLERGGEFAESLERCHAAAMALYKHLRDDGRFIPARAPDLDIVNWIPSAPGLSDASSLSEKIYHKAGKRNLHLALANLPADFFRTSGIKRDSKNVTSLRSVLMKPEHLDWLDRIWKIIDAIA